MAQDVWIEVESTLTRAPESEHSHKDKTTGQGKVTVRHPGLSFYRTSEVEGYSSISDVRAHALADVARWCGDQARLLTESVHASEVKISQAADGKLHDVVKFPCQGSSDWDVTVEGFGTIPEAEAGAREALRQVLEHAAAECMRMASEPHRA